jgi:hypothetical protein
MWGSIFVFEYIQNGPVFKVTGLPAVFSKPKIAIIFLEIYMKEE